jgi:hypothetical protein
VNKLIERAPQRQKHDSGPPKMLHYRDESKPHLASLCGAPVTKSCGTADIDCVVCAEMWENRP